MLSRYILTGLTLAMAVTGHNSDHSSDFCSRPAIPSGCRYDTSFATCHKPTKTVTANRTLVKQIFTSKASISFPTRSSLTDRDSSRSFCDKHGKCHQLFDCSVRFGQLGLNDVDTYLDFQDACGSCAESQRLCLLSAKNHSQSDACATSTQLCIYRAYAIPQPYDLNGLCEYLKELCTSSTEPLMGSVCGDQNRRCKACPSAIGAERDACIGAAMTLNDEYTSRLSLPSLLERRAELYNPFEHDLANTKALASERYAHLCNNYATLLDSCTGIAIALRNVTQRNECIIRAQLCYSLDTVVNHDQQSLLDPLNLCQNVSDFGHGSKDLPRNIREAQNSACRACSTAPTGSETSIVAWTECFMKAITLNGSFAVTSSRAIIQELTSRPELKPTYTRNHFPRDVAPYDCARYKTRCDAATSNSLGISLACDEQFRACSICKDQGNDSNPGAFATCLYQALPLSNRSSIIMKAAFAIVVIDARSSASVNCTVLLDACKSVSVGSDQCAALYNKCIPCVSTDPDEFLGCIMDSDASHGVSLARRRLVDSLCNCTSTSNCMSPIPNRCPASCTSGHAITAQVQLPHSCGVDYGSDGKLNSSLYHSDIADVDVLEKRVEPEDHAKGLMESLDIEMPVLAHKFDPTKNSLDNYRPQLDEEDFDLDIDDYSTVNCAVVSRSCLTNPLMDTVKCSMLTEDCYRCAAVETHGCVPKNSTDNFTGNTKQVREQTRKRVLGEDTGLALCGIATAQVCYNAVFSFGTTIASDDVLGYSCAQAKRSCDQKAFAFNEHSDKNHLIRDQCQQQHDACIKCHLQERDCRWTGDLNTGIGKLIVLQRPLLASTMR